MSGASASGAREPSRCRQQHLSHGDVEPFPVVGRPHTEDGRITRVRVTVDLHKLLQAGDDPRRESAHHRPAP